MADPTMSRPASTLGFPFFLGLGFGTADFLEAGTDRQPFITKNRMKRQSSRSAAQLFLNRPRLWKKVCSYPMKRLHFFLSLLALIFFAGCAGIDHSERSALLQHNVSPVVYDKMMQRVALTLGDVIELSQRKVPPGIIIRYLYSSRAVYFLDKSVIASLNQAHVSQEVLDYLLQTPSLFGPRPYYPRPYYYGRAWYPGDAYYPGYPYYPQPYGGPVIVVGSRWR